MNPAIRMQCLSRVLIFCLCYPLIGQAEEAYNVDFSSSDTALPQETPPWLNLTRSSGTTLAEVSCTLVPPFPAHQQLLVTALFEDAPDGFLRVERREGEKAVTLSENILEGVRGLNQRTLLVSDLSVTTPTTLTWQSSASVSTLRRITWQWVEPRTILTDEESSPAVVLRGSSILREEEITGQSWTMPLIRQKDHLVAVPLQDQAEPLQEGVAIVAVLPSLPAQARLAAKSLHLGLGDRLAIWINGQRMLEVSPQWPSLRDNGYLQPVLSQEWLYAGWLDWGQLLPSSPWKIGENLLEIRPVDLNGAAIKSESTLKEATLELKFPDSAANAPQSLPPASTPENTAQP